jgi:outer membrane protein OmpA-like peptidoglycan-associated protein
MFHGMTAKPPPPAPGLNAPFPNLSSVPAKPKAFSAESQRQVRAQLEAANQAARAQLQPPAPAHETMPAAAAPRQAPPLLIGFAPGSAIVQRRQRAALRDLVRRRGDAAAILAAGFAPSADAAGLNLALHRALAIADQLTNAGLPPAEIRLAALASGHGGVAELIYPSPSQPRSVPSKDRRKD